MWYKTGTINVTLGSDQVTGTGTNFIEGANAGEAVQVGDVEYEIKSIESATSLTIARDYAGSDQVNQGYAIVPTQGLVARLATQVKGLITEFTDTKDGIITKVKAGDGTVTAPSITFNSDQNSGLFKVGADNLGVVSGGVNVLEVTPSGLGVNGNAVVSGASPQILLQTGSTHLNWQMAAQENVGGAFEISSGATDADASDDTYTPRFVVSDTGTATMDGLIVGGALKVTGQSVAHATNSLVLGQEGSGVAQLRAYGPNGTTNGQFEFAVSANDGSPSLVALAINGAGQATFTEPVVASDGIHLGGTGAANKLDDYEETDFTATLRGASSEPSTLVTVIGYATKIGRVVHYAIGFEDIITTGYSGRVTITGLPFNNNGGRAMGNLVGYNGLTYSGTDAFSIIDINSATLQAKTISSNSPWDEGTHNAGIGRYLWLTGTYMTTA